MRKVNLSGNSLAYLLCQEQKRRVAHGQDQMRKVSLTGNSLAYLLCQEQKRVPYGQDHGPGLGVITFIRTGTVSLSGFGTASSASCADKQDEPELV